jgi:hypothetical protein
MVPDSLDNSQTLFFYSTRNEETSFILQVVCNNSLQNSRKIGISIILNCLCRGLHIMITNQCLFENVSSCCFSKTLKILWKLDNLVKTFLDTLNVFFLCCDADQICIVNHCCCPHCDQICINGLFCNKKCLKLRVLSKSINF